MTTIPNEILVDSAAWAAAESTVNGQPNDQALDRECFQRLANRDKWLRTKLASGVGSTKQLFNWWGEESSTGVRWECASATYNAGVFSLEHNGWTLNSTEAVPLFFPLDFLPEGTIVTGGSATFVIPSNHSTLPDNLPRIGIVHNYGGSVSFYSLPISAPTIYQYDNSTIQLTFPTLVELVDSRSMAMFVLGESGNNALPGLRVSQASITYTNPFA